MGRVAVVFTGGTISMTVDAAAGGARPVLDGRAILARTPGLAEIADVVAVDYGLVPASHFSFTQLLELAAIIDGLAADPAVDGVVVVQGTDTIEETSFLWDLCLATSKPVVVSGAMRNASEDGYDGPANLRDAVRCAAAPALHGEGVVVVMAGSIHAADDVLKSHASAVTTFSSPNLGPLGGVDAGRVILSRRRGGRRRVRASVAAEPILLVTAAIGTDGSLVEAGRSLGPRGVVVEATGAGNTHPGLLEACARAMAEGIPVVLTTRCPAGRAGATYAFPGGGGSWVRAGALLAGYLGGPKARIALALGLGAGLDRERLAVLLGDPPG